MFDDMNIRKTMIHQLNYNDFVGKDKGTGLNNFVQYKNKLEFLKNNGIDFSVLNKLIEQEKLENFNDEYFNESKVSIIKKQNLPNYKIVNVQDSPMNTNQIYKTSK